MMEFSFTFTNNEDEVFSSFKLNPTDINVAARAEELTEYFEQLQRFYSESHFW